MIDLKQIVIPTDLSEHSLHAVKYGCSLAEQFGSHVHLLHIVSHPFADFVETCQRDFGKSFDEYDREHRQAAERRLNEIDTDPLSDSRQITRVVRAGFPVADIPEYCSAVNADLLVLCTHGVTGLTHVLMGSVCESVVRRARCPVLTIRAP